MKSHYYIEVVKANPLSAKPDYKVVAAFDCYCELHEAQEHGAYLCGLHNLDNSHYRIYVRIV